ncbi:aldehyde dehydrogenase family protein [Zhongshania aliphaticivorans]|uniref:aldehyde dehydrogenase family protein n=1 Tax=Zhongshania aliphaticivorans TaxID=1470434 RepID=UPI0039C93BE9
MTTLTANKMLFINNEWLAGESSPQEVINPADESLIGMAPIASSQQTAHAIAAARDAFDNGPWPRMKMAERVGYMQKMHDYLYSRKAELVELIRMETGCSQQLADFLQFELPMKHARQLMADALQIQSEMIRPEVTPAMDGSKALGTAEVVYAPIGVVSAITAYNFPFFLNVVKIYHALTMGNTVILKPSPLTPFEAFIFGDAALAIGLPKGVLNIVNGDIDTGTLLSTDPRVDMVTFTGSDKVGAAIVAQSAPTLKKTHMELGGKSALIVRADADIQKAAMAAVSNFTIHAGQGCALTTRVLAHQSIRKPLLDAMQAMLAHVKVGNPVDPSVSMGPLIRANARDRVEYYVGQALDTGANLVFGGRRPDIEKGFYYLPTLFDGVDNSAVIAQQEIFGPVSVVIGFDNDQEAIAMANHSDFGLSGGIFSADAGRAYEMALEMRTGGVAINGGAGTVLSSAPFGGYKRSGFGREYGRQGLLDFTETKVVSFHAG